MKRCIVAVTIGTLTGWLLGLAAFYGFLCLYDGPDFPY